MPLSKYAVYGSKKKRFIKEQQANWFMSKWWIRTLLSKTRLSGDVLF